MKNFWKKLPKPIITLAPLADVTDAPFRRLIAKYSAHTRVDGSVGGPDIMFTEFVSADGLVRASEEGKKKLMTDLIYSEEERPIIAQLFGGREEYMEKATALCARLGFDGIDINMGCPDRSVEKQGAGAAMIQNPENARRVIQAAKRGAPSLPISVKTRLGYSTDELEEWLPALLEEKLSAVTIHARTRKEMSLVPARWERVKRAVEIRDEVQNETWKRNNENQCPTLILGNGDVRDVEDAKAKANATGADGVMLGRAVFGNPWLFHPSKRLPEQMTLSGLSVATHRTGAYGSDTHSTLPRPASQGDTLSSIEIVTLEERLRVMVEHTKLFEELLPHKNFAVMKKHYKAYANGFNGAKELRMALMETTSAIEVEEVVKDFLAHR